jgi:c-di-GMP-binding flagellar brake protein YcgR
MNLLSPISEVDVDERYRTVGLRPVAFMLAGLVRDAESFSVFFAAGQETFQTLLLAVLTDKNQLIFDCSGSQESNRAFLQSGRNIFVGRPGGIRMQFTCGPAKEVIYEGSPAFAVALPEYVLRLQCREFFRIETPRIKPLEFFGRLPDGTLLKQPVHDISVSGLGLNSAQLPEGLDVGVPLTKCRLALPGDPQDLFFNAIVRYLSELEARGGHRQWRVGMQFTDLTTGDENRLQRYIGKLERERRELR